MTCPDCWSSLTKKNLHVSEIENSTIFHHVIQGMRQNIYTHIHMYVYIYIYTKLYICYICMYASISVLNVIFVAYMVYHV